MHPVDTKLGLPNVLALLLLYIFAAMVVTDAWVIYRLVVDRRVLPRSSLVARRPVPWGGWTVLLFVVLNLVLPVAAMLLYARVNGLRPGRGEIHFSLTEGLAIQAVSNVLLIILAPLILRLTTRSPFRDLGLSFNKWWLQVAVGSIAFFAIEPVLMAIQFVTTRLWESTPHPLFKMVLDEFSPGVPQLAILLAVVAAPIWEEVMFRGIIQKWMVSRFERLQSKPSPNPAEIVAAATVDQLLPAGFHSSPELAEIRPEDESPGTLNHLPSQLPNDPDTSNPLPAVAGIVTTSLIFAALHLEQWPAPIAVFVLSVAIGFVYHRTGSLIAAFCMHALFNGLSTLMLLGVVFSAQSAQRPEVKTVKPPAIVAGFAGAGDCACIHCEK